MERSAMELMSDRLAAVEGLYFPRSFLTSKSSDEHFRRKAELLNLLSRDASIFLERYGSELTAEELRTFDTMKEDYEVRWHLNRLRISKDPTEEEERIRTVMVKNRRRAYMEELIRGGEYFSEDVMREREPYLHHEYVGRFQDQMGRVMARPGERWSETLMRRAEEAVLIQKIRREQKRMGVSREDWVGGDGEEVEQEEEEEEEEDEEEEGECDENEVGRKEGPSSEEVHTLEESTGNGPSSVLMPSEDNISAAELQDQLEQFTHIMQQKFLAGEDSLDYSDIDSNERLDDHWQKEANLDAEEKYFEDD